MLNSANDPKYLANWIRNNPDKYLMVKKACINNASASKKDISIKNIISYLRITEGFTFRDGAARLLAEHLEREVSILEGRFSKVDHEKTKRMNS